MDIGTAKPTADDIRAVPHHMIDIIPPEESFSVADFVARATIETRDIIDRGALPILCGGTGLYIDSFIYGRDFGDAASDENLRQELREYAEKHGAEALHDILKKADPVAANAIHSNNIKRVIRAIEICKTVNMTKTEWDKKADSHDPRYDAVMISIGCRDRENLYRRINERVDKMIASGLVEETKHLRDEGIFDANSTASQAIGYKEIIPYLDGVITLDEAVENLKTATRRYAKRQLTWFNRNESIVRLYREDYPDADALADAAISVIGGKNG